MSWMKKEMTQEHTGESGMEKGREVRVRSYEAGDQEAVAWLYTEGLLEGEVAANDTGADIDYIGDGYFEDERSHFWVAEVDGRVAGMIGVAPDEQDVAQIRRLRVDPGMREKGIQKRLMQQAVAFCRHHGYLKVVLDTRYERGPVMELFEQFAFQHNRSRTVQGKELLEFYLDLYHEPHVEKEGKGKGKQEGEGKGE